MPAVPTPATDIWYEDEEHGAVVVMRHGLQWQLNHSAAALWSALGKPVREIVAEMQAAFPDADPDEVAFWSVAFLVEAARNGLVDFEVR
ncbi:PqqD family protein [Dissulfurirhabdus thermomarina]|uniref:PqqD family protein n=1 Tax=Dissulfurirhabdus thermomarina TaxID=1765737 RepID=A0A6N9TS70_DISTH|nr:PqqD family protein [Dissulfurirhabdus thermomarina]NDY43270.1 PqqD family protein [Dissulfurirhabdus thermomarina]NMX24377.1 PqqD family protein [Dissulfurirhabdus thermomarina]